MLRYGRSMFDSAQNTVTAEALEAVLRHDLAQGEAMAGTVVPILRHLLTSEDRSVFSDEIIARVRGMVADTARQLLDGLAQADGETERPEPDAEKLAALSAALAGNSAFLCHVHALALEWRLTERLQDRLAFDPVLSPMLQTHIASANPEIAATAMKLLAAQVRFCQSQRRMMLPLGELPGDLLHTALITLRSVAGDEGAAAVAAAEGVFRRRYDETGSRIGLIARIVTGMGSGGAAALHLRDAGVALFLTALAIGSGQDRDVAILSTNESQLARLALALRAAGLRPEGVRDQFVALHPDVELPDGFERIGPDRAAALLAAAGGRG